MKKIIFLIFISISFNVLGQRVKFDTSLVSKKMIVDYYFVTKSQIENGAPVNKPTTTKKRECIGFVGSQTIYFITDKTLGKYFIKVPEAYKIYKKARGFYSVGRIFVWGTFGFWVASATAKNRNLSTPLALSGIGSFFVGFVLSTKGRRLIVSAVPVYNAGLNK